MSNKNWQFHFRNFDTTPQWFGVYHIGCGGAPWHEGVPRCWDCQPTNNPTGGEDSVYVPSDWVVDFDQWFKVILDGIKELEEITLIIVTEGEDADAWIDAVTTVFDIAEDTVKAALTNSNADINELIAKSKESLAKAASLIKKTPEEITQIANEMGLTHFGFLVDQSFQKYVYNDNDQTNNGHGWAILHAPPSGHVNFKLNHAFVNQGHMVMYWNSGDLGGFWLPY